MKCLPFSSNTTAPGVSQKLVGAGGGGITIFGGASGRSLSPPSHAGASETATHTSGRHDDKIRLVSETVPLERVRSFMTRTSSVKHDGRPRANPETSWPQRGLLSGCRHRQIPPRIRSGYAAPRQRKGTLRAGL